MDDRVLLQCISFLSFLQFLPHGGSLALRFERIQMKYVYVYIYIYLFIYLYLYLFIYSFIYLFY